MDSFTKIITRAKEMFPRFDMLTLSIDLEKANVDLEGLAQADDLNFAHDIVGIHANMNRETGKLENCFLPRYSK